MRRVLIPAHWAEVRLEGEIRGRTRVVRRFGWSDTNHEDAHRHAEERAIQALAKLRAGHRVPWRESKLAYGDEGLPIREEIVARTDLAVVTRNRYGARCLNEPDVWFGDIDHAPKLSPLAEKAFDWLATAVFAGTLWAAIWCFGKLWIPLGCFGLLLAVVLPIGLIIVRGALRYTAKARAADRIRVFQRIARVAAAHPGMRLAVYETPAGTRLVAMHRCYDPRSAEAQELFVELGCDPAYAQLCRIQACFRMRVSAKPWRIDLPTIPTRAVWPVPKGRRAERDEWVERYEQRATGFAACRYVKDVGDGPIDSRCAEIQRVHDEMCRARRDLPIA